MRSRRTDRLFHPLVLALLLLGSAPAIKQTFSQAVLPAIDRGLVQRVYRSPDSPETRVRTSIQSLNGPAERVDAAGAPYVAGKLIVKFRDGTSSATRVSALSNRGARVAAQRFYANFDVVSLDQSDDVETAARALAARSDVEYAQPDYRVHPTFKPNDPLYFRQWNLPDIDMERAWDLQPAAGSSITVAVLDTGVAYTNVTRTFQARAFPRRREARGRRAGRAPLSSAWNIDAALARRPIWGRQRFVAPHDFIWDTDVPVDLDGHGTHVSGTIGQTTNNGQGVAGVAFNVKLMPVKVLDSAWDTIFGAPNVGTDDSVARGIRYAVDNGARIINMSLGRTGTAGSAPVVEDAIKYAVGKGAFVAIAGGNEFEDGNPTEVIAEIANRIQGAVSVAALDRNHNRAFYSSTGNYIELAARGGSFRGFDSDGGILQQTLDLDLVETYTMSPARFTAPRFDAVAYFYLTGTSMATPHVSGLAAMLMQQGFTSPAAIEAALEKFATDRGAAGRDDETGFGEISARAALRGLGLAK
jgi:serine protease